MWRLSCTVLQNNFRFSNSHGRFSKSTKVIQDPSFESATVNIQNHSASTLTSREAEKVPQQKMLDDAESNVISDEEDGLIEQSRNRRRLKMSTRERYMDTRFILPTSNICEHLFFAARFALTHSRKAIRPQRSKNTSFVVQYIPVEY